MYGIDDLYVLILTHYMLFICLEAIGHNLA